LGFGLSPLAVAICEGLQKLEVVLELVGLVPSDPGVLGEVENTQKTIRDLVAGEAFGERFVTCVLRRELGL
jgi:hypothetical protein